MTENQIELQVQILNITYTLVGFDAIKDLKAWLDEHASNVQNDSHYGAQPTEAPPAPSL